MDTHGGGGEATLSFSFLQPLPVKVNFLRNEFDQSEQILFPLKSKPHFGSATMSRKANSVTKVVPLCKNGRYK